MKIEIDTELKQITVVGTCNLKEVWKFVKDNFENPEEWSLNTKTEYYPYYTYYPHITNPAVDVTGGTYTYGCTLTTTN